METKHLFVAFFISLIAFITSCTEQKEINYLDNVTPIGVIITGSVTNFDPNSDEPYIELGTNDILGNQKSHEVLLDDQGNFIYEFKILYPGEAFLFYNQFVNFFVFPGDSLHIDIDKEILNIEGYSNDRFEMLSYSNHSNIMTIEFSDYQIFFHDSIATFEEDDKALLEYNSKDYKSYILDRLKHTVVLNQRYINEYKSSPFFQKWLRYKTQYQAYEDLMRYRWMNPLYTSGDMSSLELTNSYLDFINNEVLNHPQAVIAREYCNFMKEYSSYIQRETFEADSLIAHKTLLKEKNKNGWLNMEQRQISRKTDNYSRDLALGGLYYWLLENKDIKSFEVLSILDPIQDRALDNYIDQLYRSLKAYIANPQFSKKTNIRTISNSIVNSLMDSLATKYEGKVIYIDFWAPWCTPCMGEVPSSKILQRKYNDKEVAFVYFGVRCSEESWKATIAEHQMEGDHYLLTNDQYSFLSNEFNIEGIPHFVIIDKKGNIHDTMAPRPSNTESIDQIFDALLSEK